MLHSATSDILLFLARRNLEAVECVVPISSPSVVSLPQRTSSILKCFQMLEHVA